MLAFLTIAYHQSRDPNWTVVWCAAEPFVAPYAEMLGCDIERFILVEDNTMEVVYNSVIDYLDSRAVDCVVIDSLPALVPETEEESAMEDFQVGLAARLTGKFYRKGSPAIKRSLTEDERPVLCLTINQWREKIGSYGDPKIAPMGRAPRFYSFVRIEIRMDELIKNSKGEPIGQTIEVRNLKNKTAPRGRRASFDVYVADGNGFKAGEVDRVRDYIDTGLLYGVITRGNAKGDETSEGNTFRFGNSKWVGRDKLFEGIRKDEELQEMLAKEVLSLTAGTDVTPSRARSTARSQSHGRKTAGKSETRATGRTVTRRHTTPR